MFFTANFLSKLVAAADQAPHFPVAFTLVYGVGFVAAVGIGSIAWYNSKRPAGWEDKGRPDFVPEVKTEESSDPE